MEYLQIGLMLYVVGAVVAAVGCVAVLVDNERRIRKFKLPREVKREEGEQHGFFSEPR